MICQCLAALISCLSLRFRQIIDLLSTDKSRYFAQHRKIIVNYRPISVISVVADVCEWIFLSIVILPF